MEERAKEIEHEIFDLKEEQDSLLNGENEQEYDDMIDDCNQEVVIGNISFNPSRVLKEMDEIAYNCGLSDFNDERLSEIEDEIADLDEELNNLE